MTLTQICSRRKQISILRETLDSGSTMTMFGWKWSSALAHIFMCQIGYVLQSIRRFLHGLVSYLYSCLLLVGRVSSTGFHFLPTRFPPVHYLECYSHTHAKSHCRRLTLGQTRSCSPLSHWDSPLLNLLLMPTPLTTVPSHRHSVSPSPKTPGPKPTTHHHTRLSCNPSLASPLPLQGSSSQNARLNKILLQARRRQFQRTHSLSYPRRRPRIHACF